MLTHIPHEVVDEALRGPLPLYVFVHAYNSHEWDVFVPHAINVSRGGVFRCGPAEEISGRNYVRIFGIAVDERRTPTAYVEVENIFAVVVGAEAAKALFEQMERVEDAYIEDMRGPLLKMHAAMAILQASVDDD